MHNLVIPLEFIPIIIDMMARPLGHWRDSAWRLLVMEYPQDLISFLLPNIAKDINFTIPPLVIPGQLYPINAISDTGSIIPDAIYKFASNKPDKQDIIFSFEQQHTDVPEFKLRIDHAYRYLTAKYLNDFVICFTLYTGKNNEIYNGCEKIRDNIGFINRYGAARVQDYDIDALKNDENPFSIAILASKFETIANDSIEQKVNYANELLDIISNRLDQDIDRRNAYNYFICRILRLYEANISIKIQERWVVNTYSISQQIRAEAAAEAAAKATAEATAETTARIFFQILPFQFELMEFRPSYKSQLIELCAQNGINKEMIDSEYNKWLKKREIKS